MWLYFNNRGQLIKTLTHGSVPFAGTTDFEIFAVFDGINNVDQIYEATIKLKKPDLYGSEYPLLVMSKKTMPFALQTEYGETTQNILPFTEGTYYGFHFDFGDFNSSQESEILLDTPGLWQVVITLYNERGYLAVQGVATFLVGEGNSDEDGVDGLDAALSSLAKELATKFGVGTTSSVVLTLPDIGTRNHIYFIKRLNSPVYDYYMWNGTGYTLLGDTTIYPGDYTSKNTFNLKTNEIDNNIKDLQDKYELLDAKIGGSPKGTYATLAALQTAFPTGNNNIYVVLADGHWYYWSGTAWADGGAYLSYVGADPIFSDTSTNPIQNKAVSNLFKYISPINLFDHKNANLGKTLNGTGELIDSVPSTTTDYILVNVGDVIKFTNYNTNPATDFMMNVICGYNENKTFVSVTLTANSYTVPSGVKFIRCAGSTSNISILNKTQIYKYNGVAVSYHNFVTPHYILKEDIKAFLPKEIYCAVGRTIEIYNNQVLPCADKYHFEWLCDTGKAYNRKFSVIGGSSNIGSHTLTLNIYNDNMDLVKTLTSTLKVVAALSTNKTILPIGDDLTNGKYWMTYIKTLSSNHISTIGTVETISGNCEGRIGWTTVEYLSNSLYIEGGNTPNPFWDNVNNKFSWTYYKTTQLITNPNGIQIWLGTNDLLVMTKEQFATNIKTMVSAIREDASSSILPIFIGLTILPSEQNGLSANKFQYKWWNTIIEGVKYLEAELIALNDNNLHLIPLVCSHDSKYNFGNVDTQVNPHCDITEKMPTNSIFPVQGGYEQIGDIIFSVYSGCLS